MLPVVKAPSPILRTPSREVRPDEFGPELDAAMDAMVETLADEKGAGLAGVQVGDCRRIILVCLGPDQVPEKMVNPVIVKASKIRKSDVEGCLSFPGRKATVSRAVQVTVTYSTPYGQSCTRTLSNFEARCVQHEIDHLAGKTIL
jgi:peptide deformylase